MCGHSGSILAWKQVLELHFVRSYGVSWFFLPGRVVLHCWSEFLKCNLAFAFEYSFRNDKCFYLSFYSSAFIIFLISIFHVRRYDGEYLSCAYVPCTMKFTTFIDESVAKKQINFQHTRGIRNLTLNCKR